MLLEKQVYFTSLSIMKARSSNFESGERKKYFVIVKEGKVNFLVSFFLRENPFCC